MEKRVYYKEMRQHMDKKSVVILDTNALIDDPRAIFSFPNSLVVIPSVVIDELDNLKDSKKVEVRRMARKAANLIDEITELYEEEDSDYMLLDNGGYLTIDGDYEVCFNTREPDKPDNIIISSAIRYAKILTGGTDYTEFLFDSVTMYSNDTNVRNKTRVQARNLNIKNRVKARHYAVIDQSLEEIDSGVSNVIISDAKISLFRKEGYIDINLPYVNGEHIFLQGESNPDKNQALGIWDKMQGRVIAIHDYKKGEPVWSIGGGKDGATHIRPMDSRQNFLVNDILDTNKNLHFVLSRVAGAGKNFITNACALNLLKNGDYDRMIMIKPMVSVEGADIGFLPGEKSEKLAPWFESFNDTMTELTNDGQMNISDIEAKIELDVVTHMRGRSIPNVIMIIDECQNFSPESIKTLLTRAGENAKIILMGDLSQIDNPRLDSSNNGLRIWADRARNDKNGGYDSSSYILLDSNFRSPLSAWASTFYE